ncbi:hypothetical protein FN846DRAFT_951303 [Sphaerosporella brunnea]|uniref:Uncharacterized protein n=1 Tax=Sphaerosporella brunnea TaxID=1250544 RepID=A0A5J5EVA0_9PEZI|nr:hypothetical protein FN846DRAFT_951303 [Sphaerosporella brunnea]
MKKLIIIILTVICTIAAARWSLISEPLDVSDFEMLQMTLRPRADAEHHQHVNDELINFSIESIESRLSKLTSSLQDFTKSPGYEELNSEAGLFFATATGDDEATIFLATQTFMTGEQLVSLLSLGWAINSLQSLSADLAHMTRSMEPSVTLTPDFGGPYTVTFEGPQAGATMFVPLQTAYSRSYIQLETSKVMLATPSSTAPSTGAAPTKHGPHATLVVVVAAVVAAAVAA